MLKLGFALALGLGGVALTLLPQVLALEEQWGLGALFALRGQREAPDAVAIVGISRDSAAALGVTEELDTWSRALHARVVDRAAAAGASVIAFDLVFEDLREPAGDEALAGAIAAAGRVVLVERTEADSLVLGSAPGAVAEIERRFPPHVFFQTRALATAPFFLPRVPVRVGQFWAFGRADPDAPSLPSVVLQAHLTAHYETLLGLVQELAPGVAAQWPRSRADLDANRALEPTMRAMRSALRGDPALALALQARVERLNAPPATVGALRALVDLYVGPASRYLNMYGPARALRTLPYDGVINGEFDGELSGKALFVGFTETRQSGQQDDFYSVFSESTGQNLSGVEIAATAFANLLERRTVVPLTMPGQLLWVLATGVLFGSLVVSRSTARAAGIALASAGFYAGVAYWQFASEARWLPTVVPLLGQLTLGFGAVVWRNYRTLGEQRERVYEALGHYVPRALAARLAEQTVSLGAGKELVHGTCLFTDAERYTTVSEALPPDALASLMNAYYRELFRVVAEHGGEISDTAGDSMVAVWASAQPDAALRRHAIEAARAMLVAVDAFNAGRSDGQLPTRIGLASGELLLGNIGGDQRYEYRAIGDIVNTAARLQSLNRLLGTRVLADAATCASGARAHMREVGTFVLRGKSLPVTVWEPLPLRGSAGEGAFAPALASFRAGRWAEAEAAFASILVWHPGDGPARFYCNLSRAYAQQPPREWSGVVRIATGAG